MDIRIRVIAFTNLIEWREEDYTVLNEDLIRLGTTTFKTQSVFSNVKI